MKKENIQVNKKHCCNVMENVAKEKRLYLKYDNSIRCYYIMDEYNPSIACITYCPWCSTLLPNCLGEERQEILEKEYDLTDTWQGGKDYDLIPAEFHTDAWWQKRKL